MQRTANPMDTHQIYVLREAFSSVICLMLVLEKLAFLLHIPRIAHEVVLHHFQTQSTLFITQIFKEEIRKSKTVLLTLTVPP